MKKILKTALATFFTLIICFPELFVLSAKKHGGQNCQICYRIVLSEKGREGRNRREDYHGRSKAIMTRRDIKRYPWGKKQSLREELKRTQERLDRASEALAREREKSKHLETFSPEVLSWISEIRFMCICPTQNEYLSACEGLSLSDSFAECDEVSNDIVDEIIKKLYDRCSFTFPPIRFFKNEKGDVLCLACCGKGFEAAATFCSNSKIFCNLKHVLICGICGCTNTELKPGSFLLSRKYVLLSGNEGKPNFDDLKTRGKVLYVCGAECYYTDPKIFSYAPKCSLFDEIKENLKEKNVDSSIFDALNVSFDSFIENPQLCKTIQLRALENGLDTGCVDMEGSVLMKHFGLSRGCNVFSFRTTSDFCGPRNKHFSTTDGRCFALEKIKDIISLVISCFMVHEFSESDQLITEEVPKTCVRLEDEIQKPQVKKRPEILDIISLRPEKFQAGQGYDGRPTRSSSAPVLVGTRSEKIEMSH